MFPFGLPSEQNRAHHADMVWIKIGRSEYMRGDGVTIRKNQKLSFAWWEVFTPSGEIAQMPDYEGGYYGPHHPASGPSLTIAKLAAEHISADAPAYQAVAR